MIHTDETTSGRPDAASDRGSREQALKLWVVLSRAFGAVSRRVEARIVGHGLTQGEFGVLEALLHKGPMLLGEIQRKILVSSGGITYLMDRLEGGGLARREPCPTDRRALYGVLTPEGEALIRQVYPAVAATIEEAVSALSREDKEEAIGLLRTLGLGAAALPPLHVKGRRGA